MNALIFAAGLGTRLKPLTDTMPKALVPVLGRPLLQHVLDNLAASGFQEIVINVHHFAQQIIDYINAHPIENISIKISDERKLLLDTGGGIRQAATHFNNNNPFLVHNVDIMSNLDLKEFYRRNTVHANRAATLLVSKRNTSRYLLFNSEDNRLVGWTNIETGEIKSPYTNLNVNTCRAYAFAGIHLINPSLILPHMEDWNERFSIIDFYLSVCDKVPIIADVKDDLQLIDVGKLDSLAKAELYVQNEQNKSE